MLGSIFSSIKLKIKKININSIVYAENFRLNVMF